MSLQSEPIRRRPRLKWRDTAVVGGSIAIAIVVAGLFLYSRVTGYMDNRGYSTATLCEAGAPPSSDCRQAVQVTISDMAVNQKDNTQFVAVRLPSGDYTSAEFPGSEETAMQQTLVTGDSYPAEFWHGQLQWLENRRGQKFHPGPGGPPLIFFIMMGMLFLLFLLQGVVYLIRWCSKNAWRWF